MRPASYQASSWCSRTMLLRASDSHASAAPRASPARCRTSASSPHATTSPGSSVAARSSSDARLRPACPRRDAASPARDEQRRRLRGARGRVRAAAASTSRNSPSSPCARACAWSMRSDQREGSPSAAASSTMSRVDSQLPSAPRIRRRAASSACAVHSPGPVPSQRAGDGAGDRLELVVASLADEMLLDVAQARLIARVPPRGSTGARAARSPGPGVPMASRTARRS